jgi:hypothetical protein
VNRRYCNPSISNNANSDVDEAFPSPNAEARSDQCAMRTTDRSLLTSVKCAKRIRLLAAIMAGAIALLTAHLAQAQGYTYSYPQGPTGAIAQLYGINNSGQIAGIYYDPVTAQTHGFIYDQIKQDYTLLDYPGAYSTGISGINDKGHVVGTYCTNATLTSCTQLHSFLYDGTSYSNIDVPGAAFTAVTGINNSGIYVGQTDSGGFLSSGILPDPFGTGWVVIPTSINNSGEIIGDFGYQPGVVRPTLPCNPSACIFVLENGVYNFLTIFPYSAAIDPTGINDSGQIVAIEDTTGADVLDIVISEAAITHITPNCGGYAFATGINNAGIVVGFCVGVGIAPPHYAFIATPVSGITTPPVTSAKVLGDCQTCENNHPGEDQVGFPITVGTGNMFERATDYMTSGPNSLGLTRYYNSMQQSSNPTTLVVSLGTNWRSTFDRYVNITFL